MSHVDEEKSHGSLMQSPVQYTSLPTLLATKKPVNYWLYSIMHILEQ